MCDGWGSVGLIGRALARRGPTATLTLQALTLDRQEPHGVMNDTVAYSKERYQGTAPLPSTKEIVLERRAWGLKSARRITDLLARAPYLHRNLFGFMSCAGVIYRYPGRCSQSGAQHVGGFVEEAIMFLGQQPLDLAFGDRKTADCNRAARRGSVV
jgi:hypothetical protein